MQYTDTINRFDGEQMKYTIKTRKLKNGYSASVTIGTITKTVTACHVSKIDAAGVANRVVLNHREHSIL